MEVLILSSDEDIGRVAADMVAAQVAQQPDSVLGLATGSSPLALYSELVARHRKGAASFAATTMFLLDEYVGLPGNHPQSFRAFIREVFVDHIDVEPTAVHGLEGDADDLEAACLRYEAAISQAGGIDLQILGIGTNGHIGFNEPGSSLASRTQITTLTENTRQDNAQYFCDDGEVPIQAITQGIGTILDAHRIVLVAAGVHKSRAIGSAVEGPITAMLPASALQLHPRVTVIIDDGAASELEHADYYRSAFHGMSR